MEKNLLHQFEITENKIRKALEENNFVQVSKLSQTFDEQIKKMTAQFKGKHEISQQEITYLKQLGEKLVTIEKDTIKQFRKFSSENSTKTKMHNAYKNYGS